MCARFTQACSWEDAADFFGLEEIPEDLPPRYNIAPTQLAAVIRKEPLRRLRMLRWGLIPGGAADRRIGSRLINARAETVRTRPAFRAAFRARRCLVPVDGFYEWAAGGRRRRPWLLRMKNGRPFALAGLWEHWTASGETVETFTVLTTEANRITRPIHDRMPVIVAPEAFDSWLSGEDVPLGPFLSEQMVAHPVSLLVNDPAYDDPGCVAPIAAVQPPGLFEAR